MKEILKKRFNKMDEMERAITLRAQRNALIYVNAVLIVWVFYEGYKSITHGTMLNMAPVFLLFTADSVEYFSKLFLQKRAIKDDEEYKEQYSFSKTVFLIIILTVIVVIAIFSIIVIWATGSYGK